jgi:hypothetical protein
LLPGQGCKDRLFNFAQRSADFHRSRSTEPACAERFALNPAILDLGCTRNDAPHIVEG